jgi:GMP synthase (glutamine-hydrolysing)
LIWLAELFTLVLKLFKHKMTAGNPEKKAKIDGDVVFSRHSVALVLDYGSQYTQLIARRIRENGVLSMLLPGDVDMVG